MTYAGQEGSCVEDIRPSGTVAMGGASSHAASRHAFVHSLWVCAGDLGPKIGPARRGTAAGPVAVGGKGSHAAPRHAVVHSPRV